jgi:hypothetical protein
VKLPDDLALIVSVITNCFFGAFKMGAAIAKSNRTRSYGINVNKATQPK